MTDIDINNIRRLDGGTLLVFRELLHRRQATEVARRLGLSQSAVSHGLARLRDLFGDPLFVRHSHGLEPTQRALQLGPQIEALIELAGSVLSQEGGFDPSRSVRRFNLATPNFIMSLIGGKLSEAFRTRAPQAAFVGHRLLIDAAVAAVRKGEIDVAIGSFGALPPHVEAVPLYEDTYCVIARKGHPKIKGKLDAATYAEAGHVFAGHPAQNTTADVVYDPERVTAVYGKIPDRRAVTTRAYVTQWETAMFMVSSSDVLADCPRRLATRFAPQLGLQVLDPPYKAMKLKVRAIRRCETPDPGVDWLLDEVRRAVQL